MDESKPLPTVVTGRVQAAAAADARLASLTRASEYRTWLRQNIESPRGRRAIQQVLFNSSHKAYAAVLKVVLQQAYGTPNDQENPGLTINRIIVNIPPTGLDPKRLVTQPGTEARLPKQLNGGQSKTNGHERD